MAIPLLLTKLRHQPLLREFPTTGTGVVNLYNWTDYIDPALLEKFTAETGIEVILDVLTAMKLC